MERFLTSAKRGRIDEKPPRLCFLAKYSNFSPAPSALAQNDLTMSKNVRIQQITSFALSAREHVSFCKSKR